MLFGNKKVNHKYLYLCIEWHQYDGVMMKEPDKGIREIITSAFKKWTGHHRESTMKQVKMAALAMLPSWDDLVNEQEDRRAERLLEKVDQVCFCVKNCFLNEDLSTDTSAMAEVSPHTESVISITVFLCSCFVWLNVSVNKHLPFILFCSVL